MNALSRIATTVRSFLGGAEDDLRKQLIKINQPIVSDGEWEGTDYFAQLHFCPEWRAERKVVTVRLPSGASAELQLSPAMEDGVTLRMRGLAPGSAGDLYLQVCLVS